MNLSELVSMTSRGLPAAAPEVDALTEVDALREADLVDMRFDARSGTLAVLLDLRTALQFHSVNTFAIVLDGVKQVRWDSTSSQSGWFAHCVTGSTPRTDSRSFSFDVTCIGGWSLSATALAGRLLVGNVPGLPEVQSDFVEDDEEVIANGMPGWDSEFVLVGTSFARGERL